MRPNIALHHGSWRGVYNLEVEMRAFSAAEAEYLESKRLGRLATVGRDGSPQVVPVGFRLNREFKTIDVGGHGLARTKRYADVVRERRAAIVIDEVLPPWRPRGIEVRGRPRCWTTGARPSVRLGSRDHQDLARERQGLGTRVGPRA